VSVNIQQGTEISILQSHVKRKVCQASAHLLIYSVHVFLQTRLQVRAETEADCYAAAVFLLPSYLHKHLFSLKLRLGGIPEIVWPLAGLLSVAGGGLLNA